MIVNDILAHVQFFPYMSICLEQVLKEETKRK